MCRGVGRARQPSGAGLAVLLPRWGLGEPHRLLAKEAGQISIRTRLEGLTSSILCFPPLSFLAFPSSLGLKNLGGLEKRVLGEGCLSQA